MSWPACAFASRSVRCRCGGAGRRRRSAPATGVSGHFRSTRSPGAQWTATRSCPAAATSRCRCHRGAAVATRARSASAAAGARGSSHSPEDLAIQPSWRSGRRVAVGAQGKPTLRSRRTGLPKRTPCARPLECIQPGSPPRPTQLVPALALRGGGGWPSRTRCTRRPGISRRVRTRCGARASCPLSWTEPGVRRSRPGRGRLKHKPSSPAVVHSSHFAARAGSVVDGHRVSGSRTTRLPQPRRAAPRRAVAAALAEAVRGQWESARAAANAGSSWGWSPVTQRRQCPVPTAPARAHTCGRPGPGG
jgi:hypothetical protein